ncbi:hypothetical protein O181_081826 [Austropuccinia psidii MF-1]|uniref:Uncharacterized protein n=1 Tax=Austropuccinia psidii MF-1 TaxID=1389203 RepID=A0A9Q3IGB8_9BASI|nr:hypothetical protein [Austropuccinia psidii MF-1]
MRQINPKFPSSSISLVRCMLHMSGLYHALTGAALPWLLFNSVALKDCLPTFEPEGQCSHPPVLASCNSAGACLLEAGASKQFPMTVTLCEARTRRLVAMAPVMLNNYWSWAWALGQLEKLRGATCFEAGRLSFHYWARPVSFCACTTIQMALVAYRRRRTHCALGLSRPIMHAALGNFSNLVTEILLTPKLTDKDPNNSPFVEPLWFRDFFGFLIKKLETKDPEDQEKLIDDIARSVSQTSEKGAFSWERTPLMKNFQPTPETDGSEPQAPSEKEAYIQKYVKSLLQQTLKLWTDEKKTNSSEQEISQIYDSLLNLVKVDSSSAAETALIPSSRTISRAQIRLYKRTKKLINAKLIGKSYLVDLLIIFGPGGIMIPDSENGFKQLAQEWKVPEDFIKEISIQYFPVKEAISSILENEDWLIIAERFGKELNSQLYHRAEEAQTKLGGIHQELVQKFGDLEDLPTMVGRLRKNPLTQSFYRPIQGGRIRECQLLPFLEPFGYAKTVDYVLFEDMQRFLHGIMRTKHSVDQLIDFSKRLCEPLKLRYTHAMRIRRFRQQFEYNLSQQGIARFKLKIAAGFPEESAKEGLPNQPFGYVPEE